MKIVIPQLVYDKVQHWVDKTDIEVSGFGTVKYDKDTQEFHVVDAYLLKQEGGAAHTDIDSTALANLIFDTRASGLDLKWWWHSHVKMNVFWSGTDISTIKEMGQHGWIVATVFNQRKEMKSAVCYQTTSGFGTLTHTNEDIPTVITKPSVTAEVIAAWDKEFTDNVAEKKYSPPSYLNQSTQTAWSGTWEEDYYERWQERSATKASEETKSWSQEQREFAFDPGLLGYGINKEAKILGLEPAAYAALLDQPGTYGIRQGYIDRLTRAETNGELR